MPHVVASVQQRGGEASPGGAVRGPRREAFQVHGRGRELDERAAPSLEPEWLVYITGSTATKMIDFVDLVEF